MNGTLQLRYSTRHDVQLACTIDTWVPRVKVPQFDPFEEAKKLALLSPLKTHDALGP